MYLLNVISQIDTTHKSKGLADVQHYSSACMMSYKSSSTNIIWYVIDKLFPVLNNNVTMVDTSAGIGPLRSEKRCIHKTGFYVEYFGTFVQEVCMWHCSSHVMVYLGTCQLIQAEPLWIGLACAEINPSCRDKSISNNAIWIWNDTGTYAKFLSLYVVFIFPLTTHPIYNTTNTESTYICKDNMSNENMADSKYISQSACHRSGTVFVSEVCFV